MTEILTRNAAGEAQLEGIEFKVPVTRSALSVLGINKLASGDDFREDGWVYQNGEKVRKWFVRLDLTQGEGRLWEPKLQNIPLLEAKRWRWLEYTNKIMTPLWNNMVKKVKGKKFHGSFNNGTVEFGSIEGISWKWCKEPKSKLRQDLVDLYFATEKRVSSLSSRWRLFDIAFQRAVTDKYWKGWSEKIKVYGPVPNIHLTINGRDYWLGGSRDGSLGFISFPEHTHHIVETL